MSIFLVLLMMLLMRSRRNILSTLSKQIKGTDNQIQNLCNEIQNLSENVKSLVSTNERLTNELTVVKNFNILENRIVNPKK